MTCKSLSIPATLYALLPSDATGDLNGELHTFTDDRRWNTPPTPQNPERPRVQHLFESRQLARARAFRNTNRFLGAQETDLRGGPYLATVKIDSNEAADVYTPGRLSELGIPDYPADADGEGVRQKCTSIGDDLFQTNHSAVVVHPSEPHVTEYEEILVDVGKVAISAVDAPEPWERWYRQAAA